MPGLAEHCETMIVLRRSSSGASASNSEEKHGPRMASTLSSRISLRASEMAGATSVPVSWIEISSGSPPTPPAALISSRAISVAILLCSPHSAPLPVIE